MPRVRPYRVFCRKSGICGGRAIDNRPYKASRMAEVFGVTVEDLCRLRENRELGDKVYENLP